MQLVEDRLQDLGSGDFLMSDLQIRRATSDYDDVVADDPDDSLMGFRRAGALVRKHMVHITGRMQMALTFMGPLEVCRFDVLIGGALPETGFVEMLLRLL